MRTLPWLAALSLAPALSSAQTPLTGVIGPKPGSQLGRSVALVPDQNGDGHDEVLVGIPFEDTAGPKAGAVSIVSGMNGLPLAMVFGEGRDDCLGWSVAAAGDVDADGAVDFIAGAPSQCGTGQIGWARVYSGADRSVLHTVHGGSPLDWFGQAVAGAGDQDLDGHADFAVGAHSFCAGFPLPGYVSAYSGATGALRWSVQGDASWDNFGWALDALGDGDLDGVPDLIAGAPGNDTMGYDAGRFYLLSGADGAQLYAEDGEAGLHYSGFAVAGTGDLDLDGSVDYAVGVPGEQDGFGDSPHPSEFGKLQLHSGATHSVLFEQYGPHVFDHLGWAVARVGDLDLDGHAEVGAAANRYDIATSEESFGPAYIDVLSSASGAVVLHIESVKTPENHEVSLASGGDLNGDGTPDLVLGSNGETLTAGFARAYSGRALELASKTWLLNAGQPTQDLELALGPQYEGDTYLVLGSLDGTAPGFDLGGKHVPLNYDGYTLFTLQSHASAVLKSAQGKVLPASPAAVFAPPQAALPSLAGLTVNHALLVFDRNGVLSCVSAPVPGTVVP